MKIQPPKEIAMQLPRSDHSQNSLTPRQQEIACSRIASVASAKGGKSGNNGRTHYSESKADAGKAKAVELKIKSPPAPAQGATSTPQDWQTQERLSRQRQALKQKELPASAATATHPRSLSGGKEDGSDDSRCALARDVLSGAVRHPNGAPTDDYDRQVTENDVRSYCR